jgi:hypothetical protein
MQTDSELKVNAVNTPITDRLFKQLDHRSRTDYMMFIEDIAFIKNLISPNRRRAKDMPRDRAGRIIVDITDPHILEDMAFFTERADFYRKYGQYTDIYPNPAPGSTYRNFWDEEKRRCIEGYVRASDGEWITGYHYFYLNYGPILKVEEDEKEKDYKETVAGTLEDLEVEGVRSDRVEDFPDVWDGDYLFYHYVEKAEAGGKHGTILKCRGRGYSFKGGNMLVRNYFMIRSSRSYAFADESEYLTKDGILTKAWANMNFVDDNTPFTQPRDYKDTDMQKRASYKDTITRTEKGSKAEIFGITCKNDPHKGRGKRGKLLFFDESGAFPNLKKIWAVARKSVEQGRYVYGFMCTAGTGGTKGADFAAAEAFFYGPRAYNIYPLNNVFDKGKLGTDCGMFIGEYLNRQGYYDKDGNSDVTAALADIMLQRQTVRINSTDPNDLVSEKAEAPITPQEAVLRVEGSLFPVQDLKDLIAEIVPRFGEFSKGFYHGDLVINMDGDVVWKLSESAKYKVVRDFPIINNKEKEGTIEIFHMPIKVGGKIPYLRYIAGIDPYDDDHSTTNSLGSCIVFDRYTNRIVAEYTGRPSTANAFYENCFRLLKFYNAVANYENDKKGLYAYFAQRHALHLLCDNPEILTEKNLSSIKENYGNKKKGTNSGPAINQWARRLTADWLVATAPGEEESGKMNLHYVPSIAMIKEWIAWEPDGNYDRVSAFGMLMILLEDVAKIEYRETRKEKRGKLYDDDFFKRNVRSNSYNNPN